MNKIYIFAILVCLTLSEEIDNLTFMHYADLISSFNNYRKKNANIYKEIIIDSELQQSSLAELKRLIQNIDNFGEHKDFDNTYEKTYESPSSFCEFICKLQEDATSYADKCIELWDEENQYYKHLRFEYSTGGATCAKYGNGAICVMHVKGGKQKSSID